jgi:hypothetical protein
VLARFAGAVLAFVGICWLGGWLQTFRGRLYLLFLGVAFISLGANLMLPAHLAAVRLVLLGVFVLSMPTAIVLAVLETRSRLAELAERRRAMEAEMQAYLEKLKASSERLPGQGSQSEIAREKTE